MLPARDGDLAMGAPTDLRPASLGLDGTSDVHGQVQVLPRDGRPDSLQRPQARSTRSLRAYPSRRSLREASRPLAKGRRTAVAQRARPVAVAKPLRWPSSRGLLSVGRVGSTKCAGPATMLCRAASSRLADAGCVPPSLSAAGVGDWRPPLTTELGAKCLESGACHVASRPHGGHHHRPPRVSARPELIDACEQLREVPCSALEGLVVQCAHLPRELVEVIGDVARHSPIRLLHAVLCGADSLRPRFRRPHLSGLERELLLALLAAFADGADEPLAGSRDLARLLRRLRAGRRALGWVEHEGRQARPRRGGGSPGRG